MATPRQAGRAGVATDRAVVSVSDFEAEIRDLDGDCEFKNMLLYGDSGCGKTVFAGTAPNSLILACEPGYISAARNKLGAEVGRRQLRQIPNTSVALAAIDYLENGGHKSYEWVVIEGATTLETKVRLGYAAEAFDNNPEKRQHRNLPDKPDYYNTQNFIRSWISRFVDLPVNVLITAHAMRMDDDAGDRLVLPAFQQRDGALSNFVSGLMHCVGFMRPRMVGVGADARKVRRILFEQKVDPKTGTVYFAKDQFNTLIPWMDDTTMPEIMDRIDASEDTTIKAPATRRARTRS
jgi:hypothetical protein